jgi:hypothetical protein
MESLEYSFGAGSSLAPVGSCQCKVEYSWEEMLETVQVSPDQKRVVGVITKVNPPESPQRSSMKKIVRDGPDS